MRFRELPRIKRRRNPDGSETWWAEWTETARGKRSHRSVVLGDCRKIGKREARERLQEAFGAASTSRTWTVEKFVREAWLPPRMARWSHHTEVNVTYQIESHLLPAFGSMPIADVRKFDVERWLLGLARAGYARGTVEVLLGNLKSIFTEAEDNDLIDRNPARRVKLPTLPGREETKPFSDAEFAFLMALTGLEGTVVRLLLLTGLRPGEALALRHDDLQGEFLRIERSTDYPGHTKGTKANKPRLAPLPPVLRAEVEALAGATEPGRPLFARWGCVHSLQVFLSERLAPVIPDFQLRRCRATFATLLRADVADVRDLLGHATAMMTLTHYRRGISERQVAAVAELEKRVTVERIN